MRGPEPLVPGPDLHERRAVQDLDHSIGDHAADVPAATPTACRVLRVHRLRLEAGEDLADRVSRGAGPHEAAERLVRASSCLDLLLGTRRSRSPSFRGEPT